MYRQIPNLLSLSRVVFGWVFLMAYSPADKFRFVTGIVILSIAFATDRLDGFLARRWQVVSEEGYILDGLGDRAFTVSIALMLVAQHGFSPLLAWLLVFREILIYATRLIDIENWFVNNKKVRKFSEWHAIGLRTWLLSYLVADWGKLYREVDLYADSAYVAMQYTLLGLTLVFSYYALTRTILAAHRNWLV